jgi:hypothetical protein
MDTPIVSCMNCGKRAPADQFKLCFEVMVCSDCHVVATTIFDRGRTELRQLLTLLQESIRLALMEGRLAFPDGRVGKPSKRDILKTIVHLVETKDERTSPSLHRTAGSPVPDTLPAPGMPGEGDGVEAGG